MTEVATWFARRVWALMLWLMRRPWMHRLQRGHLRFFPPHRRAAAWRRFRAQERLGRRHGLRTLVVVFTLVLGILATGVTYSFAVSLAEWSQEARFSGPH